MKKKVIAIAALGSLVGAAHAQSSVTLYGLLDDGLVYNANAKGARQVEIAAGNLEGNRWGLKGVEDLGGGLQATFRLESGFDINSGALGQGGSAFGRRATVGFSNPYGDLAIGRQYDVLTVYMAGFTAGGSEGPGVTPSWAGIYGVHPGDMDNLGGTNRTNNSIRINTSGFYGVTAAAFYSLGGQAGNFTDNQNFSMAARYEGSALSWGIAYDNVRDPNYSLFGDKPSSNTVASASALNMSSPVFSGYASAHTLQVISAGAAYLIGKFRVGGEYSNVQFQHLGAEAGTGLNPSALGGSRTFNVGELNLVYLVTPELQLGVSDAYTHGSAVNSLSGAAYNQIDIGADYALSKATDLYAVGIYQHASGHDSTGKVAVAAIPNLSNSSNSEQMAATFGIRHKF